MELKRTKNTADIIKKFIIENLDNPDYKHYFVGDWMDFPDIKDIGWKDDYLEIHNEHGLKGFTYLSISRVHDSISSMALCLFPDSLHNGYGEKALDAVLNYIFVTRKYRKVSFTVDPDNKRMMAIVNKVNRIRCVGERKHHYKLRDGKYHSMCLFEAFQ